MPATNPRPSRVPLRASALRLTTVAVCLALLSLAFAPAPQLRPEPKTEIDARIVCLESSDGKPPLKFYTVRLTFTNQHDHPVWFVLPYYGERTLPRKGTFSNGRGEPQPFGGKGYKGKNGKAIEVEMIGANGFKAFRVPAKGSLDLDGYQIEAWKAIDEVAVMEARELKVNGKTPLEQWLPYPAESSKIVRVEKQALSEWENLNWDPKKFKSRDDYPKVKVTEVKAEKMRLGTLKLQRQRAKK